MLLRGPKTNITCKHYSKRLRETWVVIRPPINPKQKAVSKPGRNSRSGARNFLTRARLRRIKVKMGLKHRILVVLRDARSKGRTTGTYLPQRTQVPRSLPHCAGINPEKCSCSEPSPSIRCSMGQFGMREVCASEMKLNWVVTARCFRSIPFPTLTVLLGLPWQAITTGTSQSC